jgi:hypothetical protein
VKSANLRNLRIVSFPPVRREPIGGLVMEEIRWDALLARLATEGTR